MNDDPRRQLPSMDRLLRELAVALPDSADWVRREVARRVMVEARAALASGARALPLLERAAQMARALERPHPSRVVNATGVILHTNLGRALLAPGAAIAVAQAARHYTDLELDLESGARGDRLESIEALLCALSGAAAALVVNNNAAALLLALHTLARGREVVVSRGELVEIGGSFRVPEIIEQAGVQLCEVGATNRTHRHDYERAIGPNTGLLLKVHRSNFEQRGFVSEVPLAELVQIGARHGLPVIEDLGSATLLDLRAEGLSTTTTTDASFAPARLESGATLVCFSGDKLLGGPQAGLLLGDADTIAALRKNPLARALRLDKLSLAALDFTLRAIAEGRGDEVPTLRQLREPVAAVEARARALVQRLQHSGFGNPTLHATDAPVGGGAMPGFALPSFAVALEAPAGAAGLAAALRHAPIPVIARVADERVLLDARTLLPGDDDAIKAALEAAKRRV